MQSPTCSACRSSQWLLDRLFVCEYAAARQAKRPRGSHLGENKIRAKPLDLEKQCSSCAPQGNLCKARQAKRPRGSHLGEYKILAKPRDLRVLHNPGCARQGKRSAREDLTLVRIKSALSPLTWKSKRPRGSHLGDTIRANSAYCCKILASSRSAEGENRHAKGGSSPCDVSRHAASPKSKCFMSISAQGRTNSSKRERPKGIP